MSEALDALGVCAFEAAPSIPDERASATRGSDALSGIVIERADAARLAAIEPAWRDLVQRALEANVFMDPGLLQAAMAPTKHKFVVLLAWDSARADARLIGLWGFAMARALLPVRVLQAPAGPHSYLATPILDRSRAAAVLDAMLDAVAAAPDLPDILSLISMRVDGATMPVLRRVMAARQSRLRAFATRRRPLLQAGMDGKAYLEAALSSSSRKKLRQYRRRLAERGALTLRTCLSPVDVSVAFEDFLALEAAGWKGRRGDALGRSPSDAVFARGMISALAARGDVTIYALDLDGRPISVQIVLRCGAAAFTWKTAYDEGLQDFSPGMLLLEDYTTALLADPAIAVVDSCAFDDSSYMAVWREREELADLWIDARRGGLPAFTVCTQAQDILLRMRGLLKRWHGIGMRGWKKLRS